MGDLPGQQTGLMAPANDEGHRYSAEQTQNNVLAIDVRLLVLRPRDISPNIYIS